MNKNKQKKSNSQTVVKNKKAFHLYNITDRLEAGIELTGTEIKSIRQGKVSIAEAFCKIDLKKEEVFIHKMNISPYEQGGYTNHEPLRKRRLLLHRREIKKLKNKLVLRGFTLVPLKIYFKRGWAKVEVGLGHGKSKADKREDLKKKDAKREMKRYMKQAGF